MINMKPIAFMTRSTICRLNALLVAGFVSAALAQSTDPIRISLDQLAKAGVVFAAVKPASAAGVGVRLAGSVVYPPNRIEIVSAPATGVVQAVFFNSLENVKATQALTRLHSPQLLEWQRDYLQLAAQLELATTKTERDENLFKESIIAASRLQDTRNQLAQAQVAVQARANAQACRHCYIGQPARTKSRYRYPNAAWRYRTRTDGGARPARRSWRTLGQAYTDW